jgi:VCBS repeat
VDNGAVLSVAAVNGSAANVGNPVAGIYGTVTVNSDGTYTYALDNTNGAVQALAQGETLTDTFTTTTTDENGATSSTTLTVTINGANDAPNITVGAGDSAAETLAETNAGLSTSGTLTLTDVDTTNTVSTSVVSVSTGGLTTGLVPNNAQLLAMLTASGNLTNSQTTGPINWTFNSGSEAFNYLPAGQSLTLTYTVRATDSFGATDDQTVTITITGTNDNPVAVADTRSVTEDAADQSGYTDGNPGTTIVAGNVLTNDTDVDFGATKSVSAVNGAPGNLGSTVSGTYGTLVINSNGTYTYALDNTNPAVQALAAGQTRTDTFTYTMSDDQGATSSTTLTVTVRGANDAPVISVGAGDSDSASWAETDSGLSTSGTLSIFDVDTTNTVTAAKVNSVSIGGTYTGTVPSSATLIAMFSASGGDPSTTLQFNPNGIGWTFNSGSEAFDFLPAGQTLVLTYTVRATDSSGATDDQLVTITITGTNDSGSLVADSASANEDTTLNGNVLANDIPDPDYNEPLSVSQFTVAGDSTTYLAGQTATIPGAGTLVLNANGTYTFTPLPNYSGPVPVVTYTAGNATFSSTATLTISVNPVSDAPGVTVDNATIKPDEDTSISLGLNAPTITDAVDQNGAGTAGDNPELLGPITLSGIPSGAKLLDGTNGDAVLWTSTGGTVTIVLNDQPGYHTTGASGTLSLTTAQYEALKVLPPAESGVNFTVTASATSYEVDASGTPIVGVPGATGTTSVVVDVQAVTDPVDLKIAGSDTSHSVTINEDSTLDLKSLLTTSFNDADGSEQRSIILGNLPQGTLVNGVAVGVSGTVTLSLARGDHPARHHHHAAAQLQRRHDRHYRHPSGPGHRQ